MSHTPYRDSCPGCGHRFTLADLKEMAEGDGWVRSLRVRLDDGTIKTVTFDEYEPKCMKPLD